MREQIVIIYNDLLKIGINLIVVICAILGTHFIKIFIMKGLQIYTKENKGLINGVIALLLSIIGAFIFTSGMDFYKTAFISWIFGIGSQAIMQMVENKYFKKDKK